MNIIKIKKKDKEMIRMREYILIMNPVVLQSFQGCLVLGAIWAWKEIRGGTYYRWYYVYGWVLEWIYLILKLLYYLLN